jgi:hypothetical protein
MGGLWLPPIAHWFVRRPYSPLTLGLADPLICRWCPMTKFEFDGNANDFLQRVTNG